MTRLPRLTTIRGAVDFATGNTTMICIDELHIPERLILRFQNLLPISIRRGFQIDTELTGGQYGVA